MNSSQSHENSPSNGHRSGMLAGILGFCLWGFFPIYWKNLAHVPPLHLLAFRVIFCSIFMFFYVLATKQHADLLAVFNKKKQLLTILCSALLIGLNWYIFILAVNTGHILQASLGYYINPFLNVALGVFLLKERLTGLTKLAVTLSAIGVIYYTWTLGNVPLYSVLLASTFGLYGLLRKVAPINSSLGLTIESFSLLPIALLFLITQKSAGQFYMGTHGAAADLFIVGSGIATALPMLLFVSAARRLDYSTVGILQFIAPSCQLFCAVVIFGENFTVNHFVCFAFIWAGLLVFVYEQMARNTRQVSNMAKI